MNVIERVLWWLVRAVLMLFGLAFVLLGAVLVLVLMVVAVLWALLRGKRPVRPVFAARFGHYARSRMRPTWGSGAKPAADDVIDAEVKDVSPTVERLEQRSRR